MLRRRYVIKDTQQVYFVPLLFSLRLLSPLCSLYAVHLPAVWSEFIPSLFSPGVCCLRSSRPSPSGVPHLQSQTHRRSVSEWSASPSVSNTSALHLLCSLYAVGSPAVCIPSLGVRCSFCARILPSDFISRRCSLHVFAVCVHQVAVVFAVRRRFTSRLV